VKITFKTTYDAGKLAKAMPKIIRTYLSESILSYEKGSKEAIEESKFTPYAPIAKSTINVRKKGLSPNAKYKKTSSIKPLEHTGRLKKSIKAFKRGLKFNKYGIYHLEAHKVAPSGVADRLGFTGKGVPKRYWLKSDEKLNQDAILAFQRRIRKNFKK